MMSQIIKNPLLMPSDRYVMLQEKYPVESLTW